MRETIRISPEEEKTLRQMSESGQLPEPVVWRALQYRAAVLTAFDRSCADEEVCSNSVIRERKNSCNGRCR
jgi:hypothetical protein